MHLFKKQLKILYLIVLKVSLKINFPCMLFATLYKQLVPLAIYGGGLPLLTLCWQLPAQCVWWLFFHVYQATNYITLPFIH